MTIINFTAFTALKNKNSSDLKYADQAAKNIFGDKIIIVEKINGATFVASLEGGYTVTFRLNNYGAEMNGVMIDWLDRGLDWFPNNKKIFIK